MELRLLQPKILTQLFEVLKENTTDNLIHFHPDSIKLRATDSAKTSITYVSLWGSSLDHYKCDRYQPVGVSIPKLWSTFKIANYDDVLEMKFEESHEGTLDINIIDNHTRESKFSTNFITYDYEEDGLSGIPENLEIGSCISMDSQRFYEDLRKLESLESEYVRLRQCKVPNGANRLQLIGLGSQCHRNPTINIDEMETKDKTQRSLEELELCFPLKKLVHFTKAHCLDDKVALHLNPRGFLILQYNIKIYGELRFVIMATAEDEGDEMEEEESSDEASENPKKRKRGGGTAAGTFGDAPPQTP